MSDWSAPLECIRVATDPFYKNVIHDGPTKDFDIDQHLNIDLYVTPYTVRVNNMPVTNTLILTPIDQDFTNKRAVLSSWRSGDEWLANELETAYPITCTADLRRFTHIELRYYKNRRCLWLPISKAC